MNLLVLGCYKMASDRTRSVGGITALQTGTRQCMTDACLLEVKLAFDAASRFVGEPVIRIGTCNRVALHVNQLQLEPTGFGNGIISIRLVGCNGQMLSAVGVPSPDGRSSSRRTPCR